MRRSQWWIVVFGIGFLWGMAGCDGDDKEDTADTQDTEDTMDTDETDDSDGDGVLDAVDNCPDDSNSDQTDVDEDGIGDVCDDLVDSDGDGVADDADNCPGAPNNSQNDQDADLVGDECDNCVSDQNPDQLDSNEDGLGDECMCDECPTGSWCQPVSATEIECIDDCDLALQCTDGLCCPFGTKCTQGECKFPDIFVDEDYLRDSLRFESEFFGPNSCEVQEECVHGTGSRDLMRFSTRTPNMGSGDLYLGNPSGNALFEYAECHEHYHFYSYAYYELLDLDGNMVVPGLKQAFCLMDYEVYHPQAPDWSYSCGFQGISRGWADTYEWYLDCQFLDITDVPSGDYILRVELNYEGILAEENYVNNVMETPVTIP